MERNEYKSERPANPWLPIAWLLLLGALYWIIFLAR
jgi:hypothetical protein